jgi:hypothetical protein
VAILLLMALAQLGVHLNALGVLSVPGWAGYLAGNGCDAVCAQRDGWKGDSDVYQQRNPKCKKRFATLGLKGLRWGLVLLLLVADAAQVAGIWLALLGGVNHAGASSYVCGCGSRGRP